jgi:hypothetical protein
LILREITTSSIMQFRIGDAKTPPKVEEVMKLVQQLGADLVINTQSLEVRDRPPFF